METLVVFKNQNMGMVAFLFQPKEVQDTERISNPYVTCYRYSVWLLGSIHQKRHTLYFAICGQRSWRGIA